MFRVIWILSCVFVAGLLAIIGQMFLPLLLSSASPDGVSHGIYDLFNRSTLIKASVVVSLFFLFFTILGLGGLFFLDHQTMRKLHDGIRDAATGDKGRNQIPVFQLKRIASETGDFFQPTCDYVEASDLDEKASFRSALPASHFFDEHSQIGSRLHSWLFTNIFTTLLGLGFMFFLIALVTGVDDIVFQSQISVRQPVGGLLEPLQVGMLALAATIMSGLLCRLLAQLLINQRRSQVARFNAQLDSLFLETTGDLSGLTKPLTALADAQSEMAGDQSKQLSKVIDAALKKINEQLTGAFNDQVKSTRKLLEETEKQVTKSTVSIEAAHETLAKYARGQSGAIDKAIAAALNSYFKDDEKSRAAFTNAAADAIKAIKDGVNDTHKKASENTERTLQAFAEDYVGGLKDTSRKLEQSQEAMSRLAASLEALSARSLERTAPVSGTAKEDYLRLVGEDDKTVEEVPTSLRSVPDEDEKKVDSLRDKVKKRGVKSVPSKGSKQSSDRLVSALRDLKRGTDAEELPDL